MKYIFITIFILQFFHFSYQYNYEIINEVVPNNIYFQPDNYSSFKIFEYAPKCVSNKNIYVQLVTNDFIYLYMYDNYSNINQDEESLHFINYIKEELFSDEPNSILFKNLSCDMKYYFIVYSDSKTIMNSFFAQLTIIDADKDIINISPSLSQHFSFYLFEKEEIQLFYNHNETKSVLFSIGNNAKLKILKNDEIIYDKKEKELEPLPYTIKFEKDINYTIFYNKNESIDNSISIQFFEEEKFIKYNPLNGPMTLYKSRYYFEIDISKYEVNQYILFQIYSDGEYTFRYQYKKNFNGNNFIDFGHFKAKNYIQFKKLIEDNSLYVFIEFHIIELFSILNLIEKVEEIKSDGNIIIQGPKYLLIDYFELNNMNSIGIGANVSFFIFEQQKNYDISISSFKNTSIYITKQNNLSPENYKTAIIYFNSTNNILLQIQKYNFPIFQSFLRKTKRPDLEYFQLCQGENSIKELFFYTSINSVDYNEELFSSVFGTLDSYYIIENTIKNLSDFNFNEIKNPNFYQTYNETGYLKINCNNNKPAMLKHSSIYYSYTNELKDGNRYYLNDLYVKYQNYTFDDSLINQNIQLQFIIYGLKNGETIDLVINNELIYKLSNTPLQINYTYQNKTSELFYFNVGNEINRLVLAEIIVGNSNLENINETFEIKNLNDCFGTTTLKKNKGTIIKIPENFTQELYDFNILLPEGEYSSDKKNLFYVEIAYNKLEFIIMKEFEKQLEISPIIPLFRDNPYNGIKNLKESNNKYLYILIYSYQDQQNIIIKKPLAYDNIFYNKINTLPKSKEANKKYYYKLKLSEIGNNFKHLFFQEINAGLSIKVTISKNNIEYPFIPFKDFYQLFNILINNEEIKKSPVYINYYDIDYNDGYINFIESNESNNPDYLPLFKLDPIVQQIEGTNKIKIKMNSLSYILFPNIIKYFLIINARDDIYNIYSIITGKKEVNNSNCELMTIIEDNGTNEKLDFNIEINIKLIEDGFRKNNIYIVPVNIKNNIVEKKYLKNIDFYYINVDPKRSENENKGAGTLLIVVIIIVSILLIIAILFFILRKKKILDEDILKNDYFNKQINEIGEMDTK